MHTIAHTHTLNADQPPAFHSVEIGRLQMPRNLLQDQMLAFTGAEAKKKSSNEGTQFFFYHLFSIEKANSVRFGCVKLPMAFLLHSPIIWPFDLMRFFLLSLSLFRKHFNFDFLPSASMMLLLWQVATRTNYRILTIALCVCVSVRNFFWQQYLLHINKILAYKMNILL